MSEHPLLFTGEMARASLDGRKTQTRRITGLKVINTEPDKWRSLGANWMRRFLFEIPNDDVDKEKRFACSCPYGKVGDTLWVREGYQICTRYYGIKEVVGRYIAGNTAFRLTLTKKENDLLEARKFPRRNTPGRFMYKSLARIFLEITNIRVERVQDISYEDIDKEGIKTVPVGQQYEQIAKDAWIKLWDSINAKRYETIFDGKGNKTKRLLNYGWDKNPWVWVIEFKKL